MSRDIAVNPTDLHLAAASVRCHAEDMRTALKSSEASAQDAESGWVGQSADALQSLVPSWREFSRAIDSKLEAHSAHLDASAGAYESTDDRNAASVKKPAVSVPRLNLAD